MTTTTSVTAIRLGPVGGTPSKGYKIGLVVSGTYGAQGDKLLVKNAKTVVWGRFTTDADGIANPISAISGATITLNSATATAASGIIVYL